MMSCAYCGRPTRMRVKVRRAGLLNAVRYWLSRPTYTPACAACIQGWLT